jgi:hypothetical protein
MSGPITGAFYEWDSTVGVTGATNVTAWADQGAGGRNLGVYDGNPTTNTHTLNGLNALRFGASAATVLWRNSVVLTLPCTIYIVIKPEFVPTGTNLNYIVTHSPNSIALRGPTYAITSNTIAAGGTPDLNAHILTANFVASGTSSLWVDGVLTASGNIATDSGSNVIIADGGGLDAYFRGLLPQFISYTATHTAAQRRSVETFLYGRWFPANTGSGASELNRIARGSGLDMPGAANKWAGTTGLDLNGALNVKAGTSGLDYNGVCNVLAGTTGLEGDAALRKIIG